MMYNEKVARTLKVLGISPNLKGWAYLHDAIVITMRDLVQHLH